MNKNVGISNETIRTCLERSPDKTISIIVNGIKFPIKAVRSNKDEIILVPFLQDDNSILKEYLEVRTCL